MAKAKKALVLRTCASDMSSQNGFVWPGVGGVAKAPDWKPAAQCGNGLHGWLYGQGDHSASSHTNETAKWLVVEVNEADIVMLGGKCKFPSGKVVCVGTKKEATDYLIENEPRARNVAVIGAQLSADDKGAVIVGALGTATAGDGGTATAGDGGTATAGNRGTATAANRGTATAGYGGTATAGDGGTATAGDGGTATAGDGGTATAGEYGTATAGDGGTATAGDGGEIRIQWYDSSSSRYRTVIGYVGENGIEADTPYVLDDKHRLVRKV